MATLRPSAAVGAEQFTPAAAVRGAFVARTTCIRSRIHRTENTFDIYRFAVEQSSISRVQFLELAIVLILVLELALVFTGVMK